MYIFPLFLNNYDGRLHVFYKFEETNHFQDVEIDKILSIRKTCLISFITNAPSIIP